VPLSVGQRNFTWRWQYAAVRKTGKFTLMLMLPLLASCGLAHAATGEKRYKVRAVGR
jgi:hypothetical protein